MLNLKEFFIYQIIADHNCTYYNMIEFVNELKSTFEITEEFDFSILMEKLPIKRMYDWCCKVLAVILSNGRIIYYDELHANDLRYINIKETPRRKMGTRKQPWFVDGNSKICSYKGNDFIEYSFRNASSKDLKFIEKMRKKYNIVAPHEYSGKALHFGDEI